MLLQQNDKSNRQKLFSRLDEQLIMGDHDGMISGCFNEISKALFDIMKDDDQQNVKEQSLVFLQKIF